MSMNAGSASLSEEEDVAGDLEGPGGVQPLTSNVDHGGGGTWVLDATYKYLWDGWNPIAEVGNGS
jgi:hypothetical protein